MIRVKITIHSVAGHRTVEDTVDTKDTVEHLDLYSRSTLIRPFNLLTPGRCDKRSQFHETV